MIPVAQAYNYISVDSGFATSTMTYASGLFNDFSLPVYLILGVIIFAALVTFLIRSFTHHH